MTKVFGLVSRLATLLAGILAIVLIVMIALGILLVPAAIMLTLLVS